ncbi:anaerobic nitric oxide reductase flavorubredoxin [Clostridium formicaceticum]|uniref:Anaerobic nitric oxide reductase flavorubredoxin n=1 Tax=Clostridium formicaceticum TaxID=1497 RepID=A0AAC9RP38_9CLOT|nr:anaerobic nitric oxide reductase flavorubredoxin [Clostridium formicaceticum]AOY78054.1 MBL fold hydrolase [Clostridium formicaceticum]ARE88690.1 Anaerobic nitric oxide reductase flavorubredoxin [Clostridium formicaceticum]
MGHKVTDKVTWVGKIDWELKRFHGNEYSTHRGSSYNAYLIKDEKNVLVDTVWQPFGKAFIENLKKEIHLENIDYIVTNHAEVDHSGGLEELMREIPETPIYCTKNGVKSLKGHYHKSWNFVEVKTGDTLDIGKNKLIFIEARMLHWPDSMFTYMTGENILFSNDAFGQHYASEFLFNDYVDSAELHQEAIKYYANILTPFSTLVMKKIEEVTNFNLPIAMICPSHGVIWRENPLEIVNKYLEWARDYQENQITIVYDTMWDGTRRMAEAIAEGIQFADDKVAVKLYNVSKTDKNDVITEIFKSKAFLVGSPTINKGILFSAAGILEMIKGLGFRNKKASAFGCHGWSGENIKIITEEIDKAKITLVDDGIKEMWNPDTEALQRCRQYGKEFVEKL